MKKRISELRELFAAPSLLKHRIVLTFIYSAGLRGKEVINLKISDVNFERQTTHNRQGKKLKGSRDFVQPSLHNRVLPIL